MLGNFTAVALLITAAWLGLIAYYIYLSRQQKMLEQELEAVRTLLAQKEQQDRDL